MHTGVNRKGGEKNKREENNKYEGGGGSKMESGELRGKREFLSLPRTWQCSCSQSVPSAPGACQPASEENGTRPRQKHAVTPPPPQQTNKTLTQTCTLTHTGTHTAEPHINSVPASVSSRVPAIKNLQSTRDLQVSARLQNEFSRGG